MAPNLKTMTIEERKQKLNEEYRKKYDDAIRLEEMIRGSAFITNTEYIEGIHVYSLTPRLMEVLRLHENAMVTKGKELTQTSILSFLWIVKVKEPNELQEDFAAHVIKKKDLHKVVESINDYLDMSFMDIPPSDGEQGIPYWSATASLVDRFATEYGWTMNEIINMPYKIIWQLMRIIVRRQETKLPLGNKESDKVSGEYHIKLNAIGEEKE